MSSSAVSHYSAPGFAQQGTVDWVALYNSSVHCSVAVLARLSRAGIDPYTLQVGRVICCNFALGPQSQQRIHAAIAQLRRYGSYDRLIWFGFGIKHVVTDLSDTEEGLTLIALIAALSVTYDTSTVAHIIRELCLIGKSSEALTPSLRQWRTLVELCAGILTAADFVHVLSGFHRLMQLRSPEKVQETRTTTSSNLAMAILTLGRVTRNTIHSVTIVGGFDCAWLATFAEWVLLLDVAILDSSGTLLHRSRKGIQGGPQVSFQMFGEETNNWKPDLMIKKRSLIQSGETLFCHIDEESRGRPLNISASWETILLDTFPEAINLLSGGDTSRAFADYLFCASNLQKPHLKGRETVENTRFFFEDNPVDSLIWTREESRGHRFFQFAAKQLPELRTCLQGDFSTIPLSEVQTVGKDASNRLSLACPCPLHQGNESVKPQSCWCRIAGTILMYLWILVASEIDDDVCPSISGLRMLYNSLYKTPFFEERLPKNESRYDPGIGLVFSVFGGSVSSMAYEDEQGEHVALGGRGFCVYRKVLEDPMLDPSLIFTFRVVRGCIAHDGSEFKSVRDLDEKRPVDPTRPDWDSLLKENVQPTVTAAVEEAQDSRSIAMGYRITISSPSIHNQIIWLNPTVLLEGLRRSIQPWICLGDCQLFGKANKLRDGGLWRFPWPVSPLRQACEVQLNAVESAERIINGIREPTYKWALFEPVENENRQQMIIHNNFILYLYITLGKRIKPGTIDTALDSAHLVSLSHSFSCMIRDLITGRPLRVSCSDLKSWNEIIDIKIPNENNMSFEMKFKFRLRIK